MSTKETKTLSLWQRFKKTALTIAVVVSLMWSFTNTMDLEAFKKSVGPIGTNPPQYTPSMFMVAELGSEHLHPPVNWLTDTIIGHNDSSNMLSKLGTVNDIRSGLATTASLSNYALTSSLSGYVPTSRTLTIDGVTLDLSSNRSWTTNNTTYSAGSGLSLTGTTFANTAPDQIVTLTSGFGIATSGTYPNFTIALSPRTVNNNPGRSLVTTAAAANGFQVSSTKEADIQYSITIDTSVSLSGNSSGYVVLEICPTNSSTASDWVAVSRTVSGQSGTLVVGLVLNQAGGGQVSCTKVTPGYYARLRSVNVAGTPTYTITAQREVSY